MNHINPLRHALLEQGIKACVIPNSDPHLSEYLPEHWKLLRHFSGFTGSAGTLVVTDSKAALWTDSRYYLQAEQELQGSQIQLMRSGLSETPTIAVFLQEQLSTDDRLLLPSLLFSVEQIYEYATHLLPLGIELEHDTQTLLSLWDNRPTPSLAPLYLQDEAFSGESCSDRLLKVRQSLLDNGTNSIIIGDTAQIAWLFNVRGSDIPCNPVALAYAFVSLTEAILFVDPLKISTEVANYLQSHEVTCADYNHFPHFISRLNENTHLQFDPQNINEAIRQQLPTSLFIVPTTSPIQRFKAIKNQTEIKGLRNAMIKDGVALCRFFRWFEQARTEENEYSLTQKLTEFREEQPLFVGESFHSIAGFQANGAIVHYHPQPHSALPIKGNGLLLIDSGGQYFDGTTDITRTILIGQPTEQQRQDYTRVLKGHIAIAQIRFPKGTRGAQLDTLARQPLWLQGLDYGHGTGHGVGHFLNVHEGPQSIRPDLNPTPLEPGMILSNEPGLYRTGQYGIRIENLVTVVPHSETPFGSFYALETLTLYPYDRRLIDQSLLSTEEIEYINNYHSKVIQQLAPLLNEDEKTELSTQCQPL